MSAYDRRAFLRMTGLGALGTAGLLSACGGGNGSTAGGQQTVRYAWWGDNIRQQSYTEALELFQEENPDISIDTEFAGYTAFQERMTTQMAARDVPDIFWIAAPQVMTYEKNNMYRRLDELENLDLSDYSAEDIEFFQLNGELNTMPHGVFAAVIRYNESFLEEDGVDVPGDDFSWDDLAEFLIDYTENNGSGRKGISFDADHDLSLEAWMRQHGQELWTADGEMGFDVDVLAGWFDWWKRLLDACDWASVYQGPGFATAWYEVYADRFEPLLVTGHDAGGALSGLLALAVSPDGGLEVAGTEHCEYQCWLARPGDGDAFIVGAIGWLSEAFPGGSLALQYLPPRTPRAWLTANSSVARRAVVHTVSRGLMALEDASGVDASLAKSANKSRLKRLQREGEVVFERVTDPRAIAALLDEMAPLCDLRHGAMYDDPPFQTDALKAEFHRALARVPGLLHVTVLRCAGRIASAQINVENRGEVVLGLVTHSPWFSRHSPGKLHTLLLARALHREGYRALDLTPGGGYKDRFATRHDEVYSLRVFFSANRYYAHVASTAGRRLAKGLLASAGAHPSAVRDRVAQWLAPAAGNEDEGDVWSARSL
jgi:CelD/BcsL family acetyltransferase involved in cellulose biosynthesis